MAIWSNRVLILLGAIGIFLSSVLSYSTWKVLLIPCGGAANCNIVMQSEFASFMGISVSYIGLAGYIGLFAVALLRSTQTGKQFTRLGIIGFIMSAVALIFSLYLTYTSLAILQLKCIWCLSSLAVVLVTTIAHAALLQSDAPSKNDNSIGFSTAAATLIVALGVAGVVIKGQADFVDPAILLVDASNYSLEQALPIAAKVKGNPQAKVTVIEFADVNCGACRKAHPIVKDIIKEHGKGIQFAFRHFPLVGPNGEKAPGHLTSMEAAVISEIAAERNEFWAYMDYIMDMKSDDAMGKRIKQLNGLIAASIEIGYSSGEIQTVIEPTNESQEARKEKLWGSVVSDIKMGTDIMIRSTPTFIIYAEGHKPKAVGFNQLKITLMSSPYRQLIESGK